MTDAEGPASTDPPENLSSELLFGAAASREGLQLLGPGQREGSLLDRLVGCLRAVEEHAQGVEEILEVYLPGGGVLARFHTWKRQLVWAEAQGVASPLVPALREALRRGDDGKTAVRARAKKVRQRPLELLSGFLPKGSLSLEVLVSRHLAKTAVALARHAAIGEAGLRIWTAPPGTHDSPWGFGAGKVLATACREFPEILDGAYPFPRYLRNVLHEIPAALQLVEIADEDPLPVFARGIDTLRLDEAATIHRAVRRLLGSSGGPGPDASSRAVVAHVDHQGWIAMNEDPSLILIPLKALTDSGRVMTALVREISPPS